MAPPEVTGATKGTPAEEEEAAKLADAFHHLKVKPPKIESPEELEDFMKFYVASMDRTREPVKSTKWPKISEFRGEVDKNEVSYLTWKYEVNCLLAERSYSEEQMLNGIRRSCKGTAADILRRLGIGATIGQILKKFDATYSMIDSGESIMRKFFACSQDSKETVSSYATRVEEIFSRAVEMKMLLPTQEDLLRSVLYQGLQTQLKQLSNYKYETVKDYDKFKVELRKIESEWIAQKGKDTATSHAATKMEPERKTELGEVKDLLKNLHDRIDRLEREKEDRQYNQQDWNQPSFRGPGFGRGYRGFRGNGGRGQYTPRRPTGTNTFRPAGYRFSGNEQGQQEETRSCFHCKQRGHIARNCPEN